MLGDDELWHGTALFPTVLQQEAAETLLSDLLAGLSGRIAAGSVVPTLDMARFRAELDSFDFGSPKPLVDVLRWVVASLERGLVQLTHPRYFGLFNPAPSFASQCADRVVAAFNPQLATFTTSPAAVEMEAHVIRAVAARAGLPAGAGGHFTTGGAEANYTAVIAALTAADPRFAEIGTRCFAGPPAIYISREAHLAWLKIAHQAGIGREAVRLVPTDGEGRMDPRRLRDGMASDRSQGRMPIMVAATAGTTGAGMIDPLPDCAEAARHEGAWFHVDAAWGGGLIASDRQRHVLAGLEQAHSITIDAHKWFATTMGCGMFLIRDPNMLSAAFQVSTSYMPSNLAGRDPYVTSVQWSRRFLGLRLFASLAVSGWEGHAAHVEQSLALASTLADRLAGLGWSVINRSPVAVVCLLPPAGSAEPAIIVERVLRSGTAWISTARFEEQLVIRACITHGQTRPSDVERLVEVLEAARHV